MEVQICTSTPVGCPVRSAGYRLRRQDIRRGNMIADAITTYIVLWRPSRWKGYSPSNSRYKAKHLALAYYSLSNLRYCQSFTVTTNQKCIPKSLRHPSLAFRACQPSLLPRHSHSLYPMASPRSPTPPPSSLPSSSKHTAPSLTARRPHR